MLSSSRLERAAFYALAAARTALCAWRAGRQSITIDEAHTYNHYIDGPWSNYYATYIPHNHVLFSLLARCSVGVLGPSEFALRLPAVAAGFFLILAVCRILDLTTPRALRWIAILGLALNPLLLDFSVAARGYGVGLAFIAWGIYACLAGRAVFSGILFGLAISAQLSMAIPAIALALAAALVGRAWRPVVRTGAPAMAIALAICAVPLHQADFRSFNFGYSRLTESIYSVVFGSTTDRHGMFVIPHRTAAIVVIIAILAAASWVALRTARGLLRAPRREIVPGVAFLISTGLILAAHGTIGMPYPVDRTGLYLILLFGLAWPITAAMDGRRLRLAHAALGSFFIVLFVFEFDPNSFRIWKFDMDTGRVAALIQQHSQARPPASTSVSTVWIHQPALEFYRRTLPIPSLRPVEYRDPMSREGHDYYVFQRDDAVDISHSRILFSGSESGVVLAAR